MRSLLWLQFASVVITWSMSVSAVSLKDKPAYYSQYVNYTAQRKYIEVLVLVDYDMVIEIVFTPGWACVNFLLIDIFCCSTSSMAATSRASLRA